MALLINLNRNWKRVREALVNRKTIFTGRPNKLKIYAITELRRKIVKYETICVLNNIHTIFQRFILHLYSMQQLYPRVCCKCMLEMINLKPKLGAGEW